MTRVFTRSRSKPHGFTLFEVLIAMAVFAFAVVGLITAINTAMQAALEVRERSLIRQELESRLALRMGVPLNSEKQVINPKENRGIAVEETLAPYPLTNKNGEEIQNIKKLTIKVSVGSQSDTASILVNE